MSETPYQFGYRQAFTSIEKVIPYDHTIFDTRLDKIAYTHGWDNGYGDRLKKETTDDSNSTTIERLDANVHGESILSAGS